MSTAMLERRLTELERRLAAVENLLPYSAKCEASTAAAVAPLTESESGTPFKTEQPAAQKPQDSWQELFGWHKDDNLFRDAARAGAEWRRKMNQVEESQAENQPLC